DMDECGIRAIALRGTEDYRLRLSLPPVLKRGRATGSEATGSFSEKGAPRTPRRQEPSSLLIENPVRSGQSIIFPNGDITVLGSVASGAEVVAGGSIHIYGTLRGRAMAEARGTPRARIVCSKNQAH